MHLLRRSASGRPGPDRKPSLRAGEVVLDRRTPRLPSLSRLASSPVRRARLALSLSLLAVAVAGCFFLGHDETGRIRDRATGEGYRLLEEAKWFHAMGAFREALEIDPDHAPAHYGLGRVFTETGYLEGAEREFLRAVALDPRYGEAYVGLARLYYASGRMEEAEKSIANQERRLNSGRALSAPSRSLARGWTARRATPKIAAFATRTKSQSK